MGRKGSQLRRFKDSLASVTRPTTGKRKKRTFSEKDPERTAKLKQIEGQFNVFGAKFTRSKHEVFGRKVKGNAGKPGMSKALGEQNRKNALIKARQKKTRAGGVIDRRFGENDPNMDPEEQMLERFAREKQSRMRNSALYNLEDDVQLTHFGQSLAEIDDFDQTDLLSVSDDDDNLAEPVVVRPTHWPETTKDEKEPSPEQGPEYPKTKAQVMSELIAKSKAYKHERQQQHEEDVEDIEALDAELPSLKSLLRNVQPQKPVRMEKTAEMLSYDAAIREMVHDKRSQPAVRTKTEEEIALEEMERLQRLEEARLRRMKGEDGDEEDGRRMGREGDDLDDDFVPDPGEEDFYGFGNGVDESGDVPVEGEDVISDEGPSEGESNGDEEDDADDDFDISHYFSDEETGEIRGQKEDDDNIIPATKKLRIQEPPTLSSSKELAYTFPCPSTMDEMLDILKDVPTDSIPIVIERIEILHSTKLLAENRQKLETLTPLVFKLILSLAAQNPLPVNAIKAIIVRLHGLTTQFPGVLTSEFFSALEASRKRFANSLAGDKVFPTAQELILFYTVGQIYPPSDLVHIIVNPTMLFMGQILGQMKVKTVQDLARGLFVASLSLQFQNLSMRYVPEILNFINLTLGELGGVKVPDLPETRQANATATLRLLIKGMPKEEPPKPTFSSLFDDKSNEPERKIQVFLTTLELLEAASETWKSNPSYPEIFHSTIPILTHISTTKLFAALPTSLQTQTRTLLSTLIRRAQLSKSSRSALALQSHRPIPIPSYLPRFSMSHSFDSKNDPDHVRAAQSRLKAVHRRERKSLVRELRKEARTEAVVRSEEGKMRDRIYEEKMKVAEGIMRAGNDVGKWERDQKRKRR